MVDDLGLLLKEVEKSQVLMLSCLGKNDREEPVFKITLPGGLIMGTEDEIRGQLALYGKTERDGGGAEWK